MKRILWILLISSLSVAQEVAMPSLSNWGQSRGASDSGSGSGKMQGLEPSKDPYVTVDKTLQKQTQEFQQNVTKFTQSASSSSKDGSGLNSILESLKKNSSSTASGSGFDASGIALSADALVLGSSAAQYIPRLPKPVIEAAVEPTPTPSPTVTPLPILTNPNTTGLSSALDVLSAPVK